MGTLNLLGAYTMSTSAQGVEPIMLLMVMIKAGGYLALAFWARSWSVIACLLILLWHLIFSYTLIQAPTMALQMTFWVPLAFFVWGLMGALTKSKLIKKCRSDNKTTQ